MTFDYLLPGPAKSIWTRWY